MDGLVSAKAGSFFCLFVFNGFEMFLGVFGFKHWVFLILMGVHLLFCFLLVIKRDVDH